MSTWVWQQSQWPNFTYAPAILQEQEKQFAHNAGYLLGAYQHISSAEQEQMKIDLVSEEAIETSAIEGEFLDRASVQASLRRIFGLSMAEQQRIPPPEQGIAMLMADIYTNFSQPLTNEMICSWHLHLMNSRIDLHAVGSYRQHADPMQIVSGTANKFKVHYEAPPSEQILQQMTDYIGWYNNSARLGTLVRAGIAHLYFELIHPFEDGNGRIGRAITEKAVFQSLGQPLFSAFSKTIQANKKKYYAALAACNTNLDITEWLIYFADTMLAAQDYTKKHIEFTIAKAKLYDRIKTQLNPRQAKVIAKIFAAGVEGYKGGLSAENYITITQTSRATATRDLQDLVVKKILYSTGERKSTRYFIVLD